MVVGHTDTTTNNKMENGKYSKNIREQNRLQKVHHIPYLHSFISFPCCKVKIYINIYHIKKNGYLYVQEQKKATHVYDIGSKNNLPPTPHLFLHQQQQQHSSLNEKKKMRGKTFIFYLISLNYIILLWQHLSSHKFKGEVKKGTQGKMKKFWGSETKVDVKIMLNIGFENEISFQWF